jgi:hypothetical protein
VVAIEHRFPLCSIEDKAVDGRYVMTGLHRAAAKRLEGSDYVRHDLLLSIVGSY